MTYDPSDYSTSQIANYAPATAVVSNYKPIGQTVGGVTRYNEVPNVLTPFASGGKAGTLKPLDALRWIRTSAGATAWNVRDLGGWPCDGGTVKYGLLFRGGKLAAADRAQSGYAAIGANEDAASLIHLKAGDTLRIKGASLPASNDSYSAIALHNASGTFNTSTYLHNGLTWNGMTFNNAGDSVVVTAVGEHYFRVSMICTDASKVVVTVNEAIE